MRTITQRQASRSEQYFRLPAVGKIENERILLLDQDTDAGRSWSLPGGRVEPGERLDEALRREMAEETGLQVEVGRLLYLCDHVPGQIRVAGSRFLHGRQTQHRAVAAAALTHALVLPRDREDPAVSAYAFRCRIASRIPLGTSGRWRREHTDHQL